MTNLCSGWQERGFVQLSKTIAELPTSNSNGFALVKAIGIKPINGPRPGRKGTQRWISAEDAATLRDAAEAISRKEATIKGLAMGFEAKRLATVSHVVPSETARKRYPISIHACANGSVYCICDDSTIWVLDGNGWEQLPEVPGA